MNGLQSFESTTEQTTETMPPNNKTITAAAMRTNRITSLWELLRKRAFLFYRLLKWCRLFLWQMFRSNAIFCHHFEFSLAFRLFASKKWIDCVQLFKDFFDKIGKSEIGLLLFANSWFSVLGRGVMGVTSANFQVVGNMHNSIEVLIIDVITCWKNRCEAVL